ncbi:hypothetical protein AT267_18585 [Bacillus cereus]|nr:hypothetical protein AT267_18585 [Bacillus cereus]
MHSFLDIYEFCNTLYNKKRIRKTSNFLTNIRVFLQFCHLVNVFIALPFTIFFGRHSELQISNFF